MKQMLALSHSVQHSPFTRSVVRDCYARVAAGTRSFHSSVNSLNTETAAHHLVSVNVYRDNMSELAYLLRLLKSLSESNKWITLIAPPAGFSTSLLVKAGIDAKHIRIARPTPQHDASSLLEKALTCNTSAAVVAFGQTHDFDTADQLAALNETPTFVINGFGAQLH
ncbi:SulA-like leucine-rich domain-containing protein [Enterovibrio coralii]|uniref:Uncharacterized protein n=1 Tax=Enterovibrio coralii TaxID=294935 RepID=A0A135I9C2_9GAMM|nr:SulA-like leucine-rich domain-containing protein [Enterovibrio coralii]KXF81984.1 hypothetical protein ATN88_18725 [Enterovibrio coralii]